MRSPRQAFGIGMLHGRMAPEEKARAMADFEAGRTGILVAHRLSTIAHLDRILVFARGRIVEEGPAERLYLAPAHPYRTMMMAGARTSFTPGIK